MTPGARRVVLASASPRREELLRCIMPVFEIAPAHLDEESLLVHPLETGVEAVAREKCLAVAARCPDALVIGADTVVAVDDVALGKPGDAAEAARMLRLLSGREHRVLTGVAVGVGDDVVSGCEITSVEFDDLSDAQIEAYVRSGEPFDKAGGYGIQGRASVFVRGIRGCYFNVVGLPLYRLSRMLERAGTVPWKDW